MIIYQKRGFIFALLALLALPLLLFLLRTDDPVVPTAYGKSVESDEATETLEKDGVFVEVDLAKTNGDVQASVQKIKRSDIERGPHHRREFLRPHKIDFRSREDRLFEESPLLELSMVTANSRHYNQHTKHLVSSTLNEGFAEKFIESGSDRFRLTLDSVNEIEIEIDDALVRGQHTRTFKGSVVGHRDSEVLIVFNGSAVGGSVVFHAENRHFEFGASGDGAILVRELDPLSYDSTCGINSENADELSNHVAADMVHSAPTSDGAVDAAQSAGPGTANTIIDTVVGYGQAARIEDGGVDAIEARILAAVDRNNEAFANSGIEDIEVVLMATIEDPSYAFPGLIDGNMGTNDELGDLNNPVDGNLDTVTDLVSELGADHATFVVKEADGAAGIAYRPGFSMITARDYMSSTGLVFAHEMGHSIGCRHAWGDSSSDLNTGISNFGWRFISPILGERKTIMAYSSWSRMPYYSNPDILIDGVRTGAVDGYNASGDSTVDPDLVSGGYMGSAGAGFDGTNPNLGANNAEYIQNNAWYVAIGDDRKVPSIQIESPSGYVVDHLFGSILFEAETLDDVIDRTLTMRNTGNTTVEGLSASLEGNDLGAFSIGSLGSTSLAPGATTTLQVTFAPADADPETVKLRIASATTNSPDAVVNLDGVYDPPLPIIQVEYPSGQALVSGSGNISFTAIEVGEVVERTFTVTNIGELELNSLAATFDTNPSGEFSAGAFGSTVLAPGASTMVTVRYTPTETGLRSTNLKIASNDLETPEFIIPLFGSLDGPIYAESFENGFGIWTNTGERDWELRSGKTPTGGFNRTGPIGAHDGDFYIFTEASRSGSDLFIVEASFDLSGYSIAELKFRYHMYGSYIGTIWVDVNVGSGWNTDVWSLTGQQQTSNDAPWGLATVDLSPYAGFETVTIRFRGQTLGVSTGDMAIDAIELSAESTSYTLAYSADVGGSINGSSTQSIAQGADGSPVEALPEEGYLFLDWSDGSNSNPRTDVNVQSDKNLIARFKLETATRYSEWAFGLAFPEGLDGPNETPLDDRLPNLIRYAFNIDPTTRGPVVLTPGSGESGTPYVTFPEGSNKNLAIEFVRRRNAIDLNYSVEFSNNLEADSWTEFSGQESVEVLNDDWERVTVVDTVSTMDESRRFVRVSVEFIDN